MTRTTLVVAFVLLLFGLTAPAARADVVVLQDWTFNINGNTNYNCTPVQGFPCTPDFPTFLSSAGFDFNTGIGTVSGTYNPGSPGSYFLILYVDHDIVSDVNNNPVDNETGATSGSPGAGQSWEIDEPGFVSGDIVENVLAAMLDNSIGASIYGGTIYPNDVAMALGWTFNLNAGEVANVTWTVSTTAPSSGFYLHQNDPLSNQDLYFYGTLNITGGTTVIPEPATGVLFLLGSAIVGAVGRRRSKVS